MIGVIVLAGLPAHLFAVLIFTSLEGFIHPMEDDSILVYASVAFCLHGLLGT
jgi:hypothetical protein